MGRRWWPVGKLPDKQGQLENSLLYGQNRHFMFKFPIWIQILMCQFPVNSSNREFCAAKQGVLLGHTRNNMVFSFFKTCFPFSKHRRQPNIGAIETLDM
jgi:hypothetical protein